MALALPKLILINLRDLKHCFFTYADEYEGVPHSVILEWNEGAHNVLARIEVEPAKSNTKYVHLRFCYANRYLARHNAEDGFVVADSRSPEEDRSKPSCTLFEPVKADDDDGNVYLIHVHTGWRAQYDGRDRMRVVPGNDWDKLSIVDSGSLVKLPEHVAFKGDNGRYLRVIWTEGHPYLQFSSYDPYDKVSGFRVDSGPDGYVRIRSDYAGMFWRLSPNWIWADADENWIYDEFDDAFWPTKIDEHTIALRNGTNGNYCKRLTTEGKTDCLNAAVSTITSESRMTVEELVQERKIYGVIYRLENARIFDEMPYIGGTTTAFNKGDEEASIEVELGYEDEKSYCFNRSLSLSAGVTTTVEASVPEIASMSVQVSYSITGTLEWGTTTTRRSSVKAKGVVRVPPRSMAVVHYVGTKGTCNVPYSYTQQDTSSTDGKIVYSIQNDGMFTGVNCYNFQFVVEKKQPI